MSKKLSTLLILSIALISPARSCSYVPTQQETRTSVEDIIHDQEIHYVDFVFFDLNGVMREITIPVRHALTAIEQGLKFDGSSIPGCSQICQSDMHLAPDLTTLTILPWGDESQKTARIICDIYLDEQTPYAGSPRHILKKVLEEVHELGYEFYVGPELEFFLFKKSTTNNLETIDTKAYCTAECNLDHWGDKKSILNYLQAQNINVEKLHHEVAPGQHELVLRYGNALNVADHLLLAKHSLTSIASAADMVVSFMPKPIFGQNGSAMHTHFSLFDLVQQQNIFYDDSDPDNLSPLGKHFIAGVLNRVYESTALLNPCINSYKRLVPGYEAPTYICWARKNRSALIRIPCINKGQKSGTRAELRSPDPASNPYLVFAFILKAGLEGIKNQEDLATSVELNLYQLNQEELDAHHVRSLPHSLENALEELEKSLFVRQLLGEQLLKQFVEVKKKELRSFKQAVTDWEHEHEHYL